MKKTSTNESLIGLLHRMPAQPIDTSNPMVVLRPLFGGTMTFDQALSAEVQEAMEHCEELAWNRNHAGRNLCQRLSSVPPAAADTVVAGW